MSAIKKRAKKLEQSAKRKLRRDKPLHDQPSSNPDSDASSEGSFDDETTTTTATATPASTLAPPTNESKYQRVDTPVPIVRRKQSYHKNKASSEPDIVQELLDNVDGDLLTNPLTSDPQPIATKNSTTSLITWPPTKEHVTIGTQAVGVMTSAMCGWIGVSVIRNADAAMKPVVKYLPIGFVKSVKQNPKWIGGGAVVVGGILLGLSLGSYVLSSTGFGSSLSSFFERFAMMKKKVEEDETDKTE